MALSTVLADLKVPGIVLASLPVAAIAIGRRPRVLAAYVTLLALKLLMRAGERESGRIVIETSLVPGGIGEAMAICALGRIAGLDMVWILGPVVVLLVTRVAIGRRSGSLITAVAGKARLSAVCTFEEEGGRRIVV